MPTLGQGRRTPHDGHPETAVPSGAGPLDPAIGGDLDDLLAALDGLGQADCARLHAFWSGTEPAALTAAHEHARDVAERTGRLDEIAAIQAELYEWGAAGRRRGTTGWGEQWVDPGQPDISVGANRQAAVPALIDTATALALQDVLDDADFDALFGPWLNAMGGDDPDAPGETDPGPA
jgi:hypothetical protein